MPQNKKIHFPNSLLDVEIEVEMKLPEFLLKTAMSSFENSDLIVIEKNFP